MRKANDRKKPKNTRFYDNMNGQKRLFMQRQEKTTRVTRAWIEWDISVPLLTIELMFLDSSDILRTETCHQGKKVPTHPCVSSQCQVEMKAYLSSFILIGLGLKGSLSLVLCLPHTDNWTLRLSLSPFLHACLFPCLEVFSEKRYFRKGWRESLPWSSSLSLEDRTPLYRILQ